MAVIYMLINAFNQSTNAECLLQAKEYSIAVNITDKSLISSLYPSNGGRQK